MKRLIPIILLISLLCAFPVYADVKLQAPGSGTSQSVTLSKPAASWAPALDAAAASANAAALAAEAKAAELVALGETRVNLVNFAKSLLGKGYAYGGNGPNVFDCSGFVCYCAASVGIALPRTSGEICNSGMQISINELRPGDIVGRSGHVGIYIGEDQFIHSQDESSGVVISSLSNYNQHIGFSHYVNIVGD